jgi:hypothetical protein
VRWRCTYTDSTGSRCENEATHRLQFSKEHPFDHVDVCEEHREEYKNYVEVQSLTANEYKEIKI